MSGPQTSRITRPSLLLRIRDSQDVEAWKTFVTVYAPLVLNYCRSRGLQGADADDVTQEVFAKINRTIGSFQYEPARGRFRDWLGRVTHGELCRYMNRTNRAGRGAGGTDLEGLPQLQTDDVGSDWSDRFYAHLLATAMEQIRSQFEPATWNAFEQAWLREKPSADVASELGIPLEAVYVAKSRVLKRLREKILELADEIPTLLVHK